MKTYQDVQTGDGRYLSLEKILGKKIKDIQCYVSEPFGDVMVVLSRIVFEDGSTLSIDGEHDTPYVYTSDLSEEELTNILKTDPDYEEDEDEEE